MFRKIVISKNSIFVKNHVFSFKHILKCINNDYNLLLDD